MKNFKESQLSQYEKMSMREIEERIHRVCEFLENHPQDYTGLRSYLDTLREARARKIGKV